MSTVNSFRNILIGSCSIAFGELLFSTGDAIVKISSLPESQCLYGRFGIQFFIAICWWICNKPKNAINWYGDKPFILNIWLRGIAYTINTITIWYAVIRLPIGDAMCIYYQCPIVIAIMAAIFLNEPLPKLTPLIFICAIIGIAFISQPTFLITTYRNLFDIDAQQDIEPLNIDGLIAAFLALISWSIGVILVRTAKTSHFIQLEIVSAGETIFLSVPSLLVMNEFIFKTSFIGDIYLSDWCFDAEAIAVMISIGILGFIALSLNVIGFQMADATKVGWLEYINIVFAFLYQIFLFNDIPNLIEFIGIVFVVIACIAAIFEESCIHFQKNQIYDPVNITSDRDL